MSEQVLLNKSFNPKVNKKALITTKDDMLLIINEDSLGKKENEIKAEDIKEINLLNAKCPTRLKRTTTYLIGFVAVIFFILEIFGIDQMLGEGTIFTLLGFSFFVKLGTYVSFI